MSDVIRWAVVLPTARQHSDSDSSPCVSAACVTLWYNKEDSVHIVCFARPSFNKHVSLHQPNNRMLSLQGSVLKCFTGGRSIGVCSRRPLWVIWSERRVLFFCRQNMADLSTQGVCEAEKSGEKERAKQIKGWLTHTYRNIICGINTASRVFHTLEKMSEQCGKHTRAGCNRGRWVWELHLQNDPCSSLWVPLAQSSLWLF